MFKLVLLVTLFNIAYVSTHSERPGKFLEHDRSIVNCARYKREANQHTCVLAPFATEGPYFLADDLERSDITDGQTGVNLDLNLKLTNAKDCSPLSGYYVHIWNANALGHYSGVQEFNKFPKQTFRPKPIYDTRWLRGYQVTNEDGEVNFKTIVPGWYYGRCLHIHVEVYSKNTTDTNAITYIGQLYFKRELPVQLKLVEPYSSNLNEMIFNEQDKVFNGMHGNDTITELIFEENNAKTSFILALDPTVTTFTNGTVVN